MPPLIYSRHFISELAVYQLKIERTEILCEVFHVLADFVVCDSGVDLGRLDIGMAQHLADRLDRHTLTECHRRCESVPRQMKCEVLIYLTYFRNLFEIAVEFLVGYDGQ